MILHVCFSFSGELFNIFDKVCQQLSVTCSNVCQRCLGCVSIPIIGNVYLRYWQHVFNVFVCFCFGQRVVYMFVCPRDTWGKGFFWGFGATTTMAIKTQ